MTTLLDIVDTAVKIGLGVTITGVTSIVLSKRMNNYETSKNQKLDQKNMVKDLAIKLEKVESILNQKILHADNNNIELAKEALLLASDEIYSSLAISNLLGHDKLVSIIRIMSSKIDDMYGELQETNPIQDKFDNLQGEFDKQKLLAYPYIREIYNDN